MDPVLYGPGEGEHHGAGSAQVVIKATGEHTGGSFFLAESTLAPGFAGPPPHRHREHHDMFYVLDGTLALRLGTGRSRPVPAALRVFRRVSCTPSATTATVWFACSSTRQPV
jgi:quercetin dioxygenase-like cupin family protein